MICEIINPSDPYTLETNDFVAAAVAIAIVGGGTLGLKCDRTQMSSPILFGWDAWFTEKGITDLAAYIQDPQKAEIMAQALESVIIGDEVARELYRDTLKLIDDPAKKKEFTKQFFDQKRSSMNDIGKACHDWAKRLRDKTQKAEQAKVLVAVS